MVQFNLLPDVKLEYNRAQHQKRLVYGLSALACLVVLVIFIISFLSVDILQKKLLNDANGQIASYSNKLKGIPNLQKILTIQNQLGTLPSLQQNKYVTSRLFDYLPQITPTNVKLGKLTLDTGADTIEFVGTANTVESVNKFVDTLEFTTYKTLGTSGNSNNNSNSSQNLAFSNVVLSQIDRSNQEATYTIDASFDPTLFSPAQPIKLIVPQKITTRSVLNAPSPVFNGDTGKQANQQGGQ